MVKRLLWIGLMLISQASYADVASTVASASSTKSTNPNPSPSTNPSPNPTPNPSPSPATTTTTSSANMKPKRADASFYVGAGVSLQNVRGYTGIMPKAFLGYGALIGMCKKAYFGAEIFGSTLSIPLSSNQRNRVSSFAGISVLPGYMAWENILIFGRIGLEVVRYNKLNMTRFGALVGVGFQYYLDPHWDLRAEYNYNFNRSLNQYNLDFVYKFC